MSTSNKTNVSAKNTNSKIIPRPGFIVIVTDVVRKLQASSASGYVTRSSVYRHLACKLPPRAGDVGAQVRTALLHGVKAGFIRRDIAGRYRAVVPIARIALSEGSARKRAQDFSEWVFGEDEADRCRPKNSEKNIVDANTKLQNGTTVSSENIDETSISCAGADVLTLNNCSDEKTNSAESEYEDCSEKSCNDSCGSVDSAPDRIKKVNFSIGCPPGQTTKTKGRRKSYAMGNVMKKSRNKVFTRPKKKSIFSRKHYCKSCPVECHITRMK